MSSELLMAAISSENLPWETMVERQPDGTLKTLAEVYWPNGRAKATRHVMADEAMAEHPEAYWRVAIRPSQMWRPPSPPEGVDVHRDRKARREYREALRASLQGFISRSTACDGCATRGGPGAGGAYWPEELSGLVSWWYWSSSSYAGTAPYVWVVYFDVGYVNDPDKSDADFVRCVRPGP